MAIINESFKRAVLLMALAAGVRLFIVGAGVSFGGRSVERYASIHDGAEYQKIARALGSLEAMRDLKPRTQRLMPGYPAAIRAVALAASYPVSALIVSIACAALATLLFFHLTNDAWFSAYLAVLTPSWLLYSSVAMSEGLFVALALWAFALWREGRDVQASLVAGLLTLVRPVGALVFLALWLVRLFSPKKKQCLPMLGVYSLAPLAWIIVSTVVWGNPLRNLDVYVEHDYAPPFTAIFRDLFSGGQDVPKQALVIFTVATNLIALVALLKEYVEKKAEETLAWLLWLLLVSLFFLALPSEWAYECMDRFFLAALPATMMGLRWALPQRWWGVAALGTAGVAVCLYWNHNMFKALTPLF